MSGRPPSTAARPGLHFSSPDEVIADVQRLRAGYVQAGRWTLAQICWHLDVTTRRRMTPEGGPVPNTPEQDARTELLAQVLATGQLPPGLVAPEALQPPTDAGEAAIEACIDAMRALAAYAGPFANHRLFGSMSDADARRNILIHAAHHLSHLMPNDSQPTPRQGLKYNAVRDVIDDLQRLRSGHRQAGKWTLAQTAWHLGLPLKMCMRPVPDDAVSSPEQQAMKSRLDGLLTMDAMPSGLPMPPGVNPLADAPDAIDDGELDRFTELLRQFESFAQPRVNFGPFGIVSNDEFRKFNLMHAANHLRHFIPTTN